MIDPIFFFYISIAILSYGIQAPLFVLFTRKYDGLLVSTYSRISLLITMLPLLFFVPLSSTLSILDHLVVLFLASAIGIAGFVASLESAKYIPVGVTGALRQGVYITTAVVLGMVFLNEFLSSLQLLLIFGILISTIFLTLSKSKQLHLDSTLAWKGYALGVLAGLGFAGSYYFFSILSRELHPFVASYFWAGGMGVLSLLWLALKEVRKPSLKQGALPLKDIFYISLISLTTLTGSVSYGFAVNNGFFALASGLAASSTLVATVIAWIIFKEKLSIKQIIFIISIIIFIFVLRIVS